MFGENEPPFGLVLYWQSYYTGFDFHSFAVRVQEAPRSIKEGRTTPPDYYQERKKNYGLSDDSPSALITNQCPYEFDSLIDRLGNLGAVNFKLK